MEGIRLVQEVWRNAKLLSRILARKGWASTNRTVRSNTAHCPAPPITSPSTPTTVSHSGWRASRTDGKVEFASSCATLQRTSSRPYAPTSHATLHSAAAFASSVAKTSVAASVPDVGAEGVASVVVEVGAVTSSFFSSAAATGAGASTLGAASEAGAGSAAGAAEDEAGAASGAGAETGGAAEPEDTAALLLWAASNFALNWLASARRNVSMRLANLHEQEGALSLLPNRTANVSLVGSPSDTSAATL